MMTRTQAGDRGEVILYRTEDGKTALDVRLAGETVRLTLNRMSELFGYRFSEGGLRKQGKVHKMHVANSTGPWPYESAGRGFSASYGPA